MATLSYIPQYDAYPYQEDTSAFPPMNAPRFSKLFNSVLGSPFLTTSDLPSSSDMTSTRSIQLDDDLETVDGSFYAVPRGHTITRPTSPTPSFRTETYSIVNWNESVDVYPSISSRPSVSDASPSCGAALRSSIWSSASATYFPYYTSTTPYNTMRFHSPTSMKGSKSLGLLPKLWDALRESSPTKKGKRRFDLSYESIWTELDAEGNIDYSNLPPLDGEEGELIDDEACFIDVRAVTGLGECFIHSHLFSSRLPFQ